MKITDVEAIWLRVPALNAPIEWGEDAFIVRIHTDSGLVGVGESDSSPAVLKALVETPASHSTSRGLREILLGEN
ncbi:MAG: mandelate racemase/muconate lactonizing enzyme family protein, partial [Pseudolabrys sp.]